MVLRARRSPLVPIEIVPFKLEIDALKLIL